MSDKYKSNVTTNETEEPVSIASEVVEKREETEPRRAVIANASVVAIRRKPSKTAEIAMTKRPGAVIMVHREMGDWCEIDLPGYGSKLYYVMTKFVQYVNVEE